uniref:zinc finger protein with KRAB and SCAN domains 1-like n=1 Tax=Monopterus albus TaxID=43700 RepID=UPI0009B336EF|nr:zinc finger protein with KRAB and SCAN domains 1-like [Monopterus albus]
MSSVQRLREFVTERLTAAAEEIFGGFEKIIVQYEEEIGRQRRLLDIVWKPEVKLIELPQQHVCKEEVVLADQQLWNQERNSSLDQEDPEPPQIKEQQEELCSSQEGEQLGLKQETNPFMLTPTYEENDHSEAEPTSDQQLLSHSSAVAESQDQEGSQPGDSGSASNAEPKPKRKRHKDTSHSSSVDTSPLSETHSDPPTDRKSLKCDTCGKMFRYKSHFNRHLRNHKMENRYCCEMCKKNFRYNSVFLIHMRTHTGERAFVCKTCGKGFKKSSALKVHLTTHILQYLREFVTERLTVAAEEIFGVFEKTVIEYEEEIDRQRRLLDIVWKPEMKKGVSGSPINSSC